MFNVEQAVNTPMGKAYVLEVSGGVAYVELTNHVEMDFLVADVQDWDEFEAEKEAAFKAERKLLRQAWELLEPTLQQRLAFGMAMVDVVFAGKPKERAEFTAVAEKVLLAKCERVIKKYEGEKK